MSLQTWKEEFYPVPADQCPKGEAVAHSLRKWRGLTDENCGKHDVEKLYGRVGELRIDSRSCALCEHYYKRPNQDCSECPLALVRGGAPCDYTGDGEVMSPYLAFEDRGDPQPMIAALEAALAREQAEAAAQAHEQAERAEQDAVERGVQEGTR